MQLTEGELLHIGEQLRAEAAAIAKSDAWAEQSGDPGLRQFYKDIANRHRAHYEKILHSIQNLIDSSQL
ncbi:MAG TPA: spore coat protein [Pelotomaculum sp.]|nr:spore coat protein [Pelotomaculum sp.]